MLHALSHRLSHLRRYAPVESVPGRSALRRFGAFARFAARLVLVAAVALAVPVSAALAAAYAAAMAGHLAFVLAAWAAVIAAAALAPSAALGLLARL